MTDLEVPNAMPSPLPPQWPEARWVGALEIRTLAGRDRLVLADAAGYTKARLLLRDGTRVLGFAELPVTAATIPRGEVDRAIAELVYTPLGAPDPHGPWHTPHPAPAIDVVICTRDRADRLREALASVLRLDYPDFRVLVIDNAPATSQTRDLIRDEFAAGRIQVIEEPKPGAANARNTGLMRATAELVAFVDDDVIVDRDWLTELAAGFDLADDVDCVCGLVPSGELRTAAQVYFDQRVTWARNLQPRAYNLRHPPNDVPMFPFAVGIYGTGANFALRRRAGLELRGMDTAFGGGGRSLGGEDIDLFTRVILRGRTLAVQPSAIVWHRNRDRDDALDRQMRGYGSGLGAWMTKVMLDRRTARMAIERSARAAARLAALGGAHPVTAGRTSIDLGRQFARVKRAEILSIARGPLLYALQRRDGTGVIEGPQARASLAGSAAEAAGEGTSSNGSGAVPELACVILAHTDPIQVRRLIRALAPFPIFLHIDSRTSEAEYHSIVTDLPDRCTLLDRRRTGWARWENVTAELEGYRTALATTGARHIALLTGTDYPLASTSDIAATLRNFDGMSIAHINVLPNPHWGKNGGIARLRYPHWVFGKHMVRLPIPRRLPDGVVFAGGSQVKVLARGHARALVEAADRNPALLRFWRRSWIADETFVPSILSTGRFVPGWDAEHVNASLWWIGWDGTRRKSPPWLTPDDRGALRGTVEPSTHAVPVLFARKFSTSRSSVLLDALDAEAASGHRTEAERAATRPDERAPVHSDPVGS